MFEGVAPVGPPNARDAHVLKAEPSVFLPHGQFRLNHGVPPHIALRYCRSMNRHGTFSVYVKIKSIKVALGKKEM